MLGNRFINNGRATVKLNQIRRDAIQEFEEECAKEDSIYKFEAYQCECGAGEENFDVLAQKDRYGLPIRTVICRNCGLVMTNPRMTQESYDFFYANLYGRLYRGIAEAPDVIKKWKNMVTHGEAVYRYVKQHWDYEFQTVLEIGCSTGGNLNEFKLHGCDVTGVDLDDMCLDFGRKQGLDLRTGHSSELLKEEKKYDLIILSHVLEHFLDLEEELEVIAKLLSENGRLYIEVPGIRDLEKGAYNCNIMGYLQNAHIRNFTLGTLTNVMEKYGYCFCTGDEKICSLFSYTGQKKEITENYFVDTMLSLFLVERAYQSVFGRKVAVEKEPNDDK